MKKIISIFSMLVLTVCMFTGCGSKTDVTTEKKESADTTEEYSAEASDEADAQTSGDAEKLLTGTHHIEIDIADYGVISVELYADIAPITVTNFINLAESGFYDGLTFHRIIDGFMIQGGDPNGNGTGGSDSTITGEFAANGYENNTLSHVRGTISMARSQDYNSASSQFFIMQSDADYLDGQYAAFGTVTDGIDIVDKICEAAVPTDSNGSIEKDKQPVITTIEVID